MIYVTTKQKSNPYQLNFEDVVLGKVPLNFMENESPVTGTITRRYDEVPQKLLDVVNIQGMISILERFNIQYKNLFEKPKTELYHVFKIPKKTGGWRTISEPLPELMEALRQLSYYLKEFGCLYHTSAMAYIEGRNTKMAVYRHVNFGSKWYLKTDLSDFFGSTTLPFIMKMLSMVFPMSEIIKDPHGKEELEKALSLGILNGGLPQGTPLSPSLTNIIMIPIDHRLFNEFAGRAMVYTRYADDMHISAKENFPYKKMVGIIEETFKAFGAPYKIKEEKTHYGNIKGRNWILGLMVNGQNQVTVGHEKKKYFKAMLNNFILDTTRNDRPWSISDVQTLYGTMQYYKMIEKEYFNNIVWKANRKWNVDAENLMKSYMRIC